MSLIFDAMTAVPGLIPQDDTVQAGIIGNLSVQSNRIENLIKTAVTMVAMAFVVYRVVVAKFAIGMMLVSALAAGVFVWIVWSVDFLSNEVGEDIEQGDTTTISETFDLGTLDLA